MANATRRVNNPASRLTKKTGTSTGLRPSVKALLDTVDRDDPAFMFIAAELHRIRRTGGTLTPEVIRDAIKVGKEQRAQHQQYLEDSRPGRIPPSIVYYARRGNVIKIGTTTRPAIRFNALLPDEIIAWEPGGHAEEAARHAEFSALRITKAAEFFRRNETLDAHMQSMKELHGNPDPTWQTLGGLPLQGRLRKTPIPVSAHMAPLPEACRRLGIRVNTARVWLHRERIWPIVRDSHGQDLFLLADLKAVSEAGRKKSR